MPAELELDAVLDDAWRRLADGARRGRHAFHTGVLTTVDPDGSPRARTVVLRDVEAGPRRLVCHTDVRSGKVEELRHGPRIGWVFYDHDDTIQLRLRGTASVHRLSDDDPLAERAWTDSRASSRRSYAVEPAPGSPLDAPGSGLPPDLVDRSPNPEESEAWRDRFAVVATTVTEIDWLLLGASGHRRARFNWSGTAWRGCWVVP